MKTRKELIDFVSSVTVADALIKEGWVKLDSPKEWYVCEDCKVALPNKNPHWIESSVSKFDGYVCNGKMVFVREVLDE